MSRQTRCKQGVVGVGWDKRWSAQGQSLAGHGAKKYMRNKNGHLASTANDQVGVSKNCLHHLKARGRGGGGAQVTRTHACAPPASCASPGNSARGWLHAAYLAGQHGGAQGGHTCKMHARHLARPA